MISKLLKKDKKGFTLMEMLIVVAIIAVLVAIAIPTFTASLNKARVATDKANIRSGYASVIADVLTNKYDNGASTYTYSLNKDGSVTEGNGGTYECQGNNDTAAEIAGVDAGTWSKGDKVTYTYTATANDAGTVTITVAAGE